ncbi:MAG: 2Fe-2S iron-sulfur cluster-binding protein [Actinomycetes bacterium]
MPKVTYVAADGSERTIDGTIGESVMVTAVKNGVPGIIGECGGNASCATCHVYVDEAFRGRLPEPNEFEEDLLDMAVSDPREGSRLGCQIKLTEELDGLTVQTPETQP